MWVASSNQLKFLREKRLRFPEEEGLRPLNCLRTYSAPWGGQRKVTEESLSSFTNNRPQRLVPSSASIDCLWGLLPGFVLSVTDDDLAFLSECEFQDSRYNSILLVCSLVFQAHS